MAPRYWTVTVAGETLTVVAGTRTAAEKIASQRLAAAARKPRSPRLRFVG